MLSCRVGKASAYPPKKHRTPTPTLPLAKQFTGLFCSAESIGEGVKRRAAFTLAEVLITLGIIGVVAAMTLPAVINNLKHKELETAFKKQYSILSQVMQKVVLDDYGGSYNADSLVNLVNNIQKHYIKPAYCINGRRCAGNTQGVFPNINFEGSDASTFISQTYKSYNGNGKDYRFNDAVIATADGAFIFFDTGCAGEITYGSTLVGIDVNGWKKKPNRYGHDFFVFQLDGKGRLIPMGLDGTFFPESQYCSPTSTSGSNGYGCTAKALNDPNYFKNLP